MGIHDMTEDNKRHDYRRQGTRSRVCVSVQERRNGEEIEHWSGDLSPDGIFLCYTIPYPVGETIDLDLYLAGRPDPLQVQGKVKNFQNKYGSFGVGVEFVDLSTEHHKIIEDFLANLDKKIIVSW